MKYRKGQLLIELLLTIGLSTLFIPILMLSLIASRDGKLREEQQSDATAILKEAEEAVRAVEKSGWSNIPVNGTYYPAISGSVWTLSPGTSAIGGFTRQVVIGDTRRATASGQIVSSGGYIDPSTKKADITISWALPHVSSITSTLYLTRTNNLSYNETTTADFSKSGTLLTSTAVVATSGTSIANDGEVDLGAGGKGDWCNPSKSITKYTLQKNGVANAISAIEGAVFVGQGQNASGNGFQRVNLTINQDPPVASNAGVFNSNSTKTNGLFSDTRYAYITTDSNHSQVIILDMTQFTDPPTNSKFKQVGSMDLGTGSVKGQSVFVTGNFAYATATNGKLYIFDVTNKLSPVLKNTGGNQIDPTSASTIGNKILVAGNYAYIATSSTTNPLRVINISNPSSPSYAGTLAPGTGQSGADLYVNTGISNPSRAYLVTSVVAGKKDFYIVNIEDPTNPKLTNASGTALGQFDTNGMTPTGTTVVAGGRALIVGTGGSFQYEVVDISSETGALSQCGGLSYTNGLLGIAAVAQSNGYAYAYVVDSSAVLNIILGGNGGGFPGIGVPGTYESAPFDASAGAAFNRFVANISQPAATSISAQVAVASPLNGDCNNATFEYVGPNGNPAAYFTPVGARITGTLPIGNYLTYYKNPGYCFRYKFRFLTNDATQTPALYDMTVNYSP